MTRALICLTAAWGLLLPGSAAAQHSSLSSEPNGLGKPADLERMNEDIEVMRRILSRALLAQPGVTSTSGVKAVTFSPDGKVLATGARDDAARLWHGYTGEQLVKLAGYLHSIPLADLHGPEGTYLKGYGVVYSMTLPLHYQDAVREPGKTAHKPLSQWERVRRELRGEKVEAEDRGGEGKDASLAERVIQALADNGRHFSQLADAEQVTVAVTLRPVASCTACHAAGVTRIRSAQGGPSGYPSAGLFDNPPAPAANAPQAPPKEVEAAAVQAQNFVQLGDMRMKQDRPREAVEAYEKAIDLGVKILAFQKLQVAEGRGPEQRGSLDEYYLKLARAYLRSGDNERALETLKKATSPAQRAAAGKPALPAKLVIAASKRLLDQVGHGKMTFEEFRKQVTVDYSSFPASEQSPAKSAPAPGGGESGPAGP
jgi:tetratricopeptide (TPR) repeat protein